VGNLRAADRLIWSAIGNTTNLAARLQSLTRELDAAIAIDAATEARAGYVCADFEPHPGVAIRGRSERFDLFALPLARVRPRGAL
jgi:adenylate cyclase